MPSLTFRTTRARVSARSANGVPELATWNLALRAHLSRRETLTVATGEELKDFEIYVTLSRNTGESLQWFRNKTGLEKAIGAAHYFPARASDVLPGTSASLIFQAYLEEPEHAALMDFARAGCLPREVTVGVDGIEYGSAPDGSDTRWDTAARPIVPITSIDFSIPVSGGRMEDDQDDDEAEAASERPPSWALELSSHLRTLVKLQTWTFYALLAVCIILFVFLRR